MANGERDVEDRLQALEAEVRVLREEAAAARALAAGADADVAEYRSEMRGHTRVLNAIREDQLDQGAKVDALQVGMGALQTDLGAVKADLEEFKAETREGFTKVNLGVAQIVAMLQNLTPDKDGPDTE